MSGLAEKEEIIELITLLKKLNTTEQTGVMLVSEGMKLIAAEENKKRRVNRRSQP